MENFKMESFVEWRNDLIRFAEEINCKLANVQALLDDLQKDIQVRAETDKLQRLVAMPFEMIPLRKVQDLVLDIEEKRKLLDQKVVDAKTDCLLLLARLGDITE